MRVIYCKCKCKNDDTGQMRVRGNCAMKEYLTRAVFWMIGTMLGLLIVEYIMDRESISWFRILCGSLIMGVLDLFFSVIGNKIRKK